MDEQSGEIVAAVLSSNNVSDSETLPQLLEQVEEPIAQISGDGGYDKRPCYEFLQERQQGQGQPLKVTIPPRRGARIWRHGNKKEDRLARDENVRCIRQLGRKRWKQQSGYHRRSLAETAGALWADHATSESLARSCGRGTLHVKPKKLLSES